MKHKHKCKFYPTSDFEFWHGEDGSLLIHPKLHRGIRKWLWMCECGKTKLVKEK
jgi:hypothetical protein